MAPTGRSVRSTQISPVRTPEARPDIVLDRPGASGSRSTNRYPGSTRPSQPRGARCPGVVPIMAVVSVCP